MKLIVLEKSKWSTNSRSTKDNRYGEDEVAHGLFLWILQYANIIVLKAHRAFAFCKDLTVVNGGPIADHIFKGVMNISSLFIDITFNFQNYISVFRDYSTARALAILLAPRLLNHLRSYLRICHR